MNLNGSLRSSHVENFTVKKMLVCSLFLFFLIVLYIYFLLPRVDRERWIVALTEHREPVGSTNTDGKLVLL